MSRLLPGPSRLAAPSLPPAAAVPTATAPPYPTRTAWIAAGGGVAVSGALLPGCNLLWPLVAPVFEHGDGRASFGCKAVSAPAFPSEQDALEILREELEAAGWGTLEREGCAEALIEPVVERQVCGGAVGTTVLDGVAVRERLDACIPDEGLAVEFVSLDDHRGLTTEIPLVACSVSSADVLGTAHRVDAQLASSSLPGTHLVGVLYDPISEELDTGWTEEDPAVADFRAQVRDLVAWLEVHR